jgi:hypothetical protein
MIETYAFLAMFTLQILIGSVLSPAWLIRRVRVKLASSAERYAQLFPGVDRNVSTERFATRHRALNSVIAVFGLVLLGWLFMHMRRPGWNPGKVPLLLTGYLLAQMSPLVVVSLRAARINKVFKSTVADGKRKAVLQRRGLFDFVSPFMVFLAVLSYLLFAALVLYIRQHPFPGFGGLTNLVVITPIYVLNALVVYGCLYGKNRNPVATYADRLYAIGVIVKCAVYTCIAVTVFASLNLTLSLLHLMNWELFALSVFFVITTLLGSLGVIPRRGPGDVRGSAGPLPPGTPDLSA